MMITLVTVAMMTACGQAAAANDPWVVYQGGDGPGKGKSVVLITGDEEYRSEEGLTQLGRILSKHHGFKCTVLYSIHPESGEIDPTTLTNIPGMQAIDKADLVIILTRFRDLPDDQMKHLVDYVNAGKPIIGLRTATHAFNFKQHKTYADYSFNAKAWDGGFGRQVLGETWLNHHGHHKHESTRGLIAPGAESHPVLSGIESGSIWGPTDVYGVRLPLPETCKPLVMGQVLKREGEFDKNDPNFGMKPTDKPLEGAKNAPMMPIAWIKSYQAPQGKPGYAFCTTMGSSTDLVNAPLRRLLVNAAYYLLGMDVPAKVNVEIVGEFNPLPYGFGGHAKDVKPADLKMD
jgi:hypothetical protein